LAALLQAVTASLDPQRVFEAVVDGSLQLLNLTMARLWVVEPSTGEIVLVARAFSPERPVNFEGVATRLPKSGGIPGWVVDQCRPRYSPVLGEDPLSARPEWVKREGFVSQLAVPLLRGEEALGALAVTARERREFSQDEQELLETFAATAALAIENARLHEETQKRLSQTETLLSVGQAVGSTLDLAEIGRRTVREMVRVLGADMGGAWRFSADRDRLFPIAGYHVPKEWADLFSRNPLVAGDSLVAEVKRLQGPLYASDSRDDPRLDHPLARLIPHKSVLIYPMWLKGKIIGGFAIIWAREVHHLTSEEMRLAEGIAGQAAIAVENARLHEELIAQMAALKRTEAQLIQSAKLAALGELATQIAHEINNPMTSILGYASLAVKDPDLPLTIRRDMEVIIQESLRTRRIVKDLLDFARRREPCMEPGDLSAALRSVIELLREPIALGNVLLVEEIPPLPQVLMDSDQIKQVLVNLINNALDAMPGGGTLTVTTGVRCSGSRGRGFGDQVEVTVADTGIGMSQEQIQRIFDPFFTTKDEGRGTGLGLSVSLRIVEGHGGRILVESRPGQGSVFRVILPLRTPHAAAKSADFMERNG
jgi:signal transduction histidine kinase